VIFATAAAVLAAVVPPGGPVPTQPARERPVVSLSASPARIALGGRGRTAIELTNVGTSRVVVGAAPRSFALDLRGRPSLQVRRRSSRSAAKWLRVSPRFVSIPAGGTRTLQLSSLAPTRAEPGDHHALVLLSTRPTGAGRVGVRMRLGVRVVVRVPGAVVRRLVVRGVRVRHARRSRILDVALSNLGNVTEQISRARATVTLLASRRVVARLRFEQRELLPSARAIVAARYRGRVRGSVVARIEIRGAVTRAFWIRL
jgi:hypothetical protein